MSKRIALVAAAVLCGCLSTEEQQRPVADEPIEVVKTPTSDFESHIGPAAEQYVAGAKTTTMLNFEEVWKKGVSPYRLLTCEKTKYERGSDSQELGRSIFSQSNGKGAVFLASADEAPWGIWDTEWTVTNDGNAKVLAAGGESSMRCENPAWETPQIGNQITTYADWVYAVTATRGEETLYSSVEENKDLTYEDTQKLQEGGWTKEKVEELILLRPSSSDYVWDSAISWAKAHNELELAEQLHSMYQPVGRCSRDTHPSAVIRDYAKTCHDNGHLECAVALDLKLLSWSMPRVSDMYVGGKPVSYDASFDELPEPIDVPTFARGLLASYPGTDGDNRATISSRFFALGMMNSKHKEQVVKDLTARLADTNLDTWNRYRISLAIFQVNAFSTNDFSQAAKDAKQLPGTPEIAKEFFDIVVAANAANAQQKD